MALELPIVVQDLLGWLAVSAAVIGLETPFIMALVQGLGKFFSGQKQLIAAIVVGVVFGVVAYLGVWGVPDSLYDVFLALLFVSANAGVPIGTYEAIKNAAAG